MGSADTRETADAYLRALAAGDIAGAVSLLAEPVEWEVPGAPTVPWVGRRSTRAEAVEFFALLDRHLRQEVFTVACTIVDGADAVLVGHLRDTVRASGATLETRFAIHMTVVDRQITRYHFFEDSYAVARALETA